MLKSSKKYILNLIALPVVGLLLSFQIPKVKEYQLKAVFLYNFIQFVEWNNETPVKNDIVIGILGEDPFGTFLDETVLGEQKDGHPLVVKRYNAVEDIDHCHILYINEKSIRDVQDVLVELKGRPFLTVGDSDDFIKKGGMIRFYKRDSKIGFQINLDEVDKAGITISSKLLRIAEIVRNKKK